MDNKENADVHAEIDELDELSAHSFEERHTPQSVKSGSAASLEKPTPYSNLRQLAGMIRRPSTPRRRRSSARSPWPSATQLAKATATPGSRRPLQPISQNRSNPTTPHAIRALQQRRNTPGFERRKSGRIQRETPRDILRNLSRALAQNHHNNPSLVEPTPANDENRIRQDNAYLDELSPEQPTLTLPIGEDSRDTDDSFDAAPPRLSMQPDGGDTTIMSLEMARRSSKRLRESGESFASHRNSERYPDMLEEDNDNISALPEEHTVMRDSNDDLDELSDNVFIARPSGDTENLRKILLEQSKERHRALGDVQQASKISQDATSPFVLQIPDYAPRQSDHGIENMHTEVEQSSSKVDYRELGEEDPLQSEAFPTAVSLPKSPKRPQHRTSRRRKSIQLSRHGIPFSSIPARVTKSMANAFARSSLKRRSKLGRDALDAVKEAGDLFLMQLGEDLGIFARHGRRRNIDETDVTTAMMRQRHVTRTASAFSLAEAHLPSDLVHKLRMPALRHLRRRRKRLAPNATDIGDVFADVL